MSPESEPHRDGCPRVSQRCPTVPCRGATDPALCAHWSRLGRWRRWGPKEQVDRTRPRLDPRVRDAVNACADRGAVLPISEQADCGCLGRELTRCHAGRGLALGKVTLLDCLDCQAARLSG